MWNKLMRLSRFWVSDPKMIRGSEHKSASLTFTVIAFVLSWIKLFLSGVTIYGHTFGIFTSEDYVWVFMGTASLYFGQKSVAVLAARGGAKQQTKEEEKSQSKEDTTSKPPIEGA